MDPVRVLIADDHPFYREGARTMLVLAPKTVRNHVPNIRSDGGYGAAPGGGAEIASDRLAVQPSPRPARTVLS